MTALGYLSAAVRWPIRQTRGFIENVEELFRGTDLEEIVPPTVEWLLLQIPHALGFGSPKQQIKASTALGVTAVISSFVTLGVTIVFVAVFAATFAVGVIRLWPVVNRFWPLPEV